MEPASASIWDMPRLLQPNGIPFAMKDFMTFVAKEFDGTHLRHIHFVRCPRSHAPGGYRSILSLEAFRGRERDRLNVRHRRRDKLGRWFYVIQFYDYMTEKIGVRQTFADLGIPRQPSAPYTKHSSIWDFYIAIGYDYKKKRYGKLRIPD